MQMWERAPAHSPAKRDLHDMLYSMVNDKTKIELLQWMIDQGADPSHGRSESLVRAIKYKRVDLVFFFIEKGACPADRPEILDMLRTTVRTCRLFPDYQLWVSATVLAEMMI